MSSSPAMPVAPEFFANATVELSDKKDAVRVVNADGTASFVLPLEVFRAFFPQVPDSAFA